MTQKKSLKYKSAAPERLTIWIHRCDFRQIEYSISSFSTLERDFGHFSENGLVTVKRLIPFNGR